MSKFQAARSLQRRLIPTSGSGFYSKQFERPISQSRKRRGFESHSFQFLPFLRHGVWVVTLIAQYVRASRHRSGHSSGFTGAILYTQNENDISIERRAKRLSVEVEQK